MIKGLSAMDVGGGAVAYGLAALLTYALTRGVRRLALAQGIQDIPNERSSHKTPTPRGGGLAIVLVTLGVWIGLGVAGLIDGLAVAGLLAGGLLIGGVGWFDDRQGVSAGIRLGVHGLAGAVLAACLRIDSIGFFTFAIIYVVWLTNIYNFMDGIDGLAAGEGVTGALALALIACFSAKLGIAIGYLALSAACLGFLALNWHPARIFMGDVGSGFLGFAFAGLSLAALSSSGSGANLDPVLAVLLVLGVFIVDSSVTLIRRTARGQKIWKAHREHAYQKAVQQGMAHAKVSGFVLALNVLWFSPLLFLAWVWPARGFYIMAVAYLLPFFLALKFKAGAAEGF